jgi:hypothetical protein
MSFGKDRGAGLPYHLYRYPYLPIGPNLDSWLYPSFKLNKQQVLAVGKTSPLFIEKKNDKK